MKKKILLPIAMFALMIGLTACGSGTGTKTPTLNSTGQEGMMGGTPPEDGGTPPDGAPMMQGDGSAPSGASGSRSTK